MKEKEKKQLEENFKAQYEICRSCEKRCPSYLIFEYASKIGLDQFDYQIKNKLIPLEIERALGLFLSQVNLETKPEQEHTSDYFSDCSESKPIFHAIIFLEK